MKTEQIPLNKLKLNTGQVDGLPKNPRFIKDDKYAKLLRSIESDPEMLELREVIAYDNGTDLIVIGGNMRLKACQELGIKKIPTKILPKDTPIEKLKAYLIKDNASFGDWNIDDLRLEWDKEELEVWGLDLPELPEDNIIVTEDEFDASVIGATKTDIVLGDLFEIGPHKLLCGDSTDSEKIKALFGDKQVDLYISDPPYGVAYKGKTKDALEIQNDALTEEQTHQLFAGAFANAFMALKEGGGVYVTVPAGVLQLGFMQVLKDFEVLRQCMVWDKGQMVLGHSDYHYRHEPILYGWKPGAAHYFTKDRTKTTVLEFKKPSVNAEHPTMKPIELWAELIQNSTKEGQLCFDSFLGSGTTLVACHSTNRIGYGVELDPKYCQVIVDRMRKLDPSLIVKKNGVKI